MRRTLIVAAGLIGLLAVGYLAEARRYSFGTAAQPGPALYPLLVGALILVGCIGMALEAAKSHLQGEVEWPADGARWRVVAIVTSALGYVLLLPYLGHPIAGALLSLVVLQVMGLANWFLKVGIAVAVGLISFYLFATLLGTPLPTGIWFE
jgi:putative tricarboxylic transport membrane protein